MKLIDPANHKPRKIKDLPLVYDTFGWIIGYYRNSLEYSLSPSIDGCWRAIEAIRQSL